VSLLASLLVIQLVNGLVSGLVTELVIELVSGLVNGLAAEIAIVVVWCTSGEVVSCEVVGAVCFQFVVWFGFQPR